MDASSQALAEPHFMTPLDPEGALLIGAGEALSQLTLRYANRHGLIAGATGTGKTVTLQVLAEGFSRQGVPVFVADVKGDLSGISQPGKPHPKVDERVSRIGITDYAAAANPVVFWDMFGRQGHPLRVTISEMGPVLLSRLLELSEAQAGVLSVVFALADDQGLPLLDFKDLRAVIQYAGAEAKTLSARYGLISTASVNALLRKLLQFEQEGGDQFFGEPALEITEFLRTDRSGRGCINVLAADELIRSPRLYATFLLWMLSELFETLPEVGDPDRPALVFFFDEAHLLFDNAPSALIEKVEQVCRLIRSKGVGVYFVTQSPQDVPVDILGQLGNRVQHALRAFTPKDQKAVRVSAETFRANPAFETGEVITQLGVGEALVSCLEAGGVPSVVDRVLIRPPASRIGAATEEERHAVMAASPIGVRYNQALDRDSAYEMLARRAEDKAGQQSKQSEVPASRARRSDSFGEALLKSVIRSAGSSLARQITSRIVRGVLGGILR